MSRELYYECDARSFDSVVRRDIEVTDEDIKNLCEQMKEVAIANSKSNLQRSSVKDVTKNVLLSWGILKKDENEKIYPTNAYVYLTGQGGLRSMIQCAVFKGTTREEIIPCKYDSVDADHGFVIVSNESENGEKFSLVNMQGEILIDSQYDYMAFLDGDSNVLCVRRDGSDFYGLIDLNNEIIADLSEREENNEYIQINSMFISDGTISVSWSNGTEELFDYSGNKLAEYSSYVRYGE